MLIFGSPVRDLARGKRLRGSVILGAAAAILLPLSAVSGVVGEAGHPIVAAVQPKSAPKAAAAGAEGYQLRCWQYGRQIIEEHGLGAPPVSADYALDMKTASGGSGVHVVDVGNATCLVQREGGEAKAKR